MKRLLVVAVVCALAVSAAYAGEEFIEGWENTLVYPPPTVDSWDATTYFDSYAFSTTIGVTEGTYSLELDLKPGWQQGLINTSDLSTNQLWTPFMPPLAGATHLRIDVTTSNAWANVPMDSGIQLSLFMQGGTDRTDPNTWFIGQKYSYELIMPVYQPNLTTQTIEWDLSVDMDGNPLPLLPLVGPDGWFDMRINTNVIGENAPAPGFLWLDNLRAVQGGSGGILGDLNNDTLVNAQDINPFVLALTDLPTWQAQYPGVDILDVGDCDSDGLFNAQDINPFVVILTTGGAVPEPMTMGLLAMGAAGLILRRRRR